MFAEAIDEVSVKFATNGTCRDCFPQFLFVFRKQYAVYQFNDCFTHLVVKIKYKTFNHYVHNRWNYDHRHISGGGRVRHLGGHSFLDKSGV